jgi:hypothetical protein
MSKKRVSTRHVGSFAEEVDKLVLQLLAGSASSERHGVDVRKVAVGLTVIRQALDIQLEKLIPSAIDQNPCAHWRNPMDMIRQG